MNSETLIVNLVVTGLVVIPYIFFIYIGQKQSLEIANVFQREISKNNLNIDVCDRWNDNAIGIDFNKQKLLFVQRRNDYIFQEIVDLSKVTGTHITPLYNRIKVNREIENQLHKLYIKLTYSDENTIKYLVFFDSDFTFCQYYEMRYAEKWNALIVKAMGAVPAVQKIAS